MSIRPTLTLLLLTTVVPELLTGSTPLYGFLNPGLLVFLTLGYGLAILLVRELAVRLGVGLGGLVLFGLAYGIFNEGLLAKTFLLPHSLPVPEYDDYGYWLGISFPWAAGISTWHAFASVVFPVALTHDFFPQASRKPWLNGKVALALGIVLLLLASLVFLGKSEKGVKGTSPQLALLFTMMSVLFVLGSVFKGSPLAGSGAPSWKPVLLGLSIIVPFTVLSTIAGKKIGPPLYFVALAGAFYAYGWLLKRLGWLSLPGFLCFGIGWYLQNAVISILVRLGNPPLAAASAVVDALILFLLWRQIRRASLAHVIDGCGDDGGATCLPASLVVQADPLVSVDLIPTFEGCLVGLVGDGSIEAQVTESLPHPHDILPVVGVVGVDADHPLGGVGSVRVGEGGRRLRGVAQKPLLGRLLDLRPGVVQFVQGDEDQPLAGSLREGHPVLAGSCRDPIVVHDLGRCSGRTRRRFFLPASCVLFSSECSSRFVIALLLC